MAILHRNRKVQRRKWFKDAYHVTEIKVDNAEV